MGVILLKWCLRPGWELIFWQVKNELKLYNGQRYVIYIINTETGRILWIAGGKKKQVVYDFIEHVSLKWMDHVEAFACDMNSDL